MSSGAASFFGNSSFGLSYIDLMQGILDGTTPVMFPQSLAPESIDAETGMPKLSDMPTAYSTTNIAEIQETFAARLREAKQVLAEKTREGVKGEGLKPLEQQVALMEQGGVRAQTYKSLIPGLSRGGIPAALETKSFVSNPFLINQNAEMEALREGDPDSLKKLVAQKSNLDTTRAIGGTDGRQSLDADASIKHIEKKIEDVGVYGEGPAYNVLSKYFSPDLPLAVSSISPEAWADASVAAKAAIDAGLANAIAFLPLGEDFEEFPEKEPAKFDKDGQHLGGGGTYVSSDGTCMWSATGDPAPKSMCPSLAQRKLAGGDEAEAAQTTIDTGIAADWAGDVAAAQEVVEEEEEALVLTALDKMRDRRYSALMGKTEEDIRSGGIRGDAQDFATLQANIDRDIRREKAQNLINTFDNHQPYENYKLALQRYASSDGPYGRGGDRMNSLINSQRELITEAHKEEYRKELEFFQDAQILAQDKLAIYEKGAGRPHMEAIADFLYLDRRARERLPHPRSSGGEKAIDIPRVSAPNGLTDFTKVVNDLFLSVEGGPGEYDNISDEIKQELRDVSSMEGDFSPGKYLKFDGWDEDPNQKYQQAWAKIAHHPANPRGEAFIKEFTSARAGAQREDLIKGLGLVPPKMPEPVEMGPNLPKEQHQLRSITDIPGGPQWSFLMQSARMGAERSGKNN